MASEHSIEKLATCFRALADENRLRIIGLLAHHPHSVEELAANLHLSSATISHHLQRLQKADLVQGHVQQYYSVYALRADVLREITQQLAALDSLKADTAKHLDIYNAQVIEEYFARGRLKSFPTQLKKRQVILQHLANQFEIGKRYSEKRVNEILKSFYSDYEILRRELVTLNYLNHNGIGFERIK
jgi:biotin operon repressor